MHRKKHDADAKRVPTFSPIDAAKTLVVHQKGGVAHDLVRKRLKCHKSSVP
jgi:hypothetical protein